MRRVFCILFLACLAPSAPAEVTARTDDSFESAHQVVLSGTPAENYRRFTGNVGQWWSSSHTFSGDAANLSIDEGCFCERWDGGWARHLEVVHAAPGKLLRLTGGLGPLQSQPVAGVMDVTFTAAEEGGTTVSLVYRVRGVRSEDWAAAVDGVIGEQLAGFEAFAGDDEEED